MAQEEHRTLIQVPKLSLDGSNWAVYRDRLKWAMQTNNFDDHAGEDSPLADYLAAGTIGGVTAQARSSAKINFSYSILFHLTTSYSSYFGGKKGISRNKTSFFSLMMDKGGECDKTHPWLHTTGHR